MSSYSSLIDSIKKEMTQQQESSFKKEASLTGNLEQGNNTGILNDLNIDLVPQQVVNDVSESLTKIAGHIDQTSSLEELVKIAEQTGNSDVGNLIKLADSIADRITDRIVSKLSENR